MPVATSTHAHVAAQARKTFERYQLDLALHQPRESDDADALRSHLCFTSDLAAQFARQMDALDTRLCQGEAP